MCRNTVTHHRSHLALSHPTGFSLLEVIIATALLASSSILLLQLLSIGERHGTKGEERLVAQMLSQNVLEEIAAGIRPLRSFEEEPLPGFPEWAASVSWVPTDLEGLVQVHVRIAKVPMTHDSTVAMGPGSPTVAQQGTSRTTTELGPHRSSYELTRWLRAKEASDDSQDGHTKTPKPSPASRTTNQPSSARPQTARPQTARRQSPSANQSLTPRRLRRESGERRTP